jgi:capsular exopolysaccharide synthesis family protein
MGVGRANSLRNARICMCTIAIHEAARRCACRGIQYSAERALSMRKRWRLHADSLNKSDDRENSSTMSRLNQVAIRLDEAQRNGFGGGGVVDAPASRNAVAFEKDVLSSKLIRFEPEDPSTQNGERPPHGSDRNPLKIPTARRSWWRQLLGTAEAERSLPALVPGSYYSGAAPFALLASRLQRWSTKEGKRAMLVTSAVAGEGKSFVAVNLATTLANLGSRVVLVDADLRAPSLDRCLGLNLPKGLAAYLAGEVELSACLYPTRVPRLTLLPAGNVTSSSTRALADGRARDCIQALLNLEPPHLVLVDSLSILSAAEVQILAGLTDSVMMVVAANRTSRAAIHNALHAINETSLFGVIFNRFELSLSASRATRATSQANCSSDINHSTTQR